MVTMAFLISDLEFFGENRRRMTLSDALRRPYLVQQVDVRWRYQKTVSYTHLTLPTTILV